MYNVFDHTTAIIAAISWLGVYCLGMNKLIARHKALTYLKEHSIMEVATVDVHGNPYVATVHYIADNDFTCYFIAKETTQKSTNLSVNHAVAGVVTDAAKAATLQLRGQAEDITSTKEAEEIMSRLAQTLREKSYWPSPAARMDRGAYRLFAILPRHVRLADFSKPYAGDDSQFFEIVI